MAFLTDRWKGKVLIRTLCNAINSNRLSYELTLYSLWTWVQTSYNLFVMI